ncbi:hypothetical protein HDU67_002211 [Dinochytrium kinnereticum]|nr:hypothetical protein HDU67_002211 [Dinochytrium kinnereticum]
MSSQRNPLTIHTVPIHVAVKSSTPLESASVVSEELSVFMSNETNESIIAPHVLEQLHSIHQELEWEASAKISKRAALPAPPPKHPKAK